MSWWLGAFTFLLIGMVVLLIWVVVLQVQITEERVRHSRDMRTLHDWCKAQESVVGQMGTAIDAIGQVIDREAKWSEQRSNAEQN